MNSRIKNKIDSIVRFFISYYLFLFYCLLNFFSSRRFYKDDMNKGVIVSLTTFSKRIDKVYLTIESICRQRTNHKFYVHLYVCNADIPNGIPRSLLRLQKRGLKIIIVDENLRSYKKLFYCYLNNKDSNIITIDDDIFYPSWWLELMLEKHIKFPLSTIAYRGHFIKFDSNGSLRPYAEFISNFRTPPEKSMGLIPTGVSGVFYPTGSLAGLEMEKDDFMSLSPTADDLWFKVLTIRNGFFTTLVLKKNIHFISIPDSQSYSLRSINLDSHQNDIQLNSILNKFPSVRRDLIEEYRKLNP